MKVVPYISHAEHVKRVKAIYGSRIAVVGVYAGALTKIRYKCRISSHPAFLTMPSHILDPRRKWVCSRCYYDTIGKRCRKKNSTYLLELSRFGFVALDKYVTATTQIRHQCGKGHVWVTAPNQVLSGYGCPICDMSQYRRRPIRLGKRTVLVQGSEGKALSILMRDGVSPSDLAITVKEGKPTFRYKFGGRSRVYVPDFFCRSKCEVIEVKSQHTLGLYDSEILRVVKAKARAVVTAGYPFRLMLIHRHSSIELGGDWYRQPKRDLLRIFRRLARAQDLRLLKKESII